MLIWNGSQYHPQKLQIWSNYFTSLQQIWILMKHYIMQKTCLSRWWKIKPSHRLHRAWHAVPMFMGSIHCLYIKITYNFLINYCTKKSVFYFKSSHQNDFYNPNMQVQLVLITRYDVSSDFRSFCTEPWYSSFVNRFDNRYFSKWNSKQQLSSRHRALLAGFFLGSNMSDSFRSTLCHNQEDSTLHTHCCVENGEEKLSWLVLTFSATELTALVTWPHSLFLFQVTVIIKTCAVTDAE